MGEEERQDEKQVHDHNKHLTFIKTVSPQFPLYILIQTPDQADTEIWVDRFQTVDVVAWLQSLISTERMLSQQEQDDYEQLVQVAELYVDAFGEDEMLTMTEALRLTMVRDAIARWRKK